MQGGGTVILIALAAAALLLAVRRRSTVRLGIAALAVLTLLGSGIMTGRLLAVARDLGVEVNPLSMGPSTRT